MPWHHKMAPGRLHQTERSRTERKGRRPLQAPNRLIAEFNMVCYGYGDSASQRVFVAAPMSNSAIRRLGVCKWTANIRVQLHVHIRPGMGWADKLQQVRNSGRNGSIFTVCSRRKVQATPGIRPFRPEFRTLLAFVGAPSYPILWRCEPGFTIYTSKLCIQGAPLRFAHRKTCFIKNGKTYRLQNLKVTIRGNVFQSQLHAQTQMFPPSAYMKSLKLDGTEAGLGRD